MIRLKPIPETAARECPHCRLKLTAVGWLITGMRSLAELRCEGCEIEFYGDLPVGQALYTPILLEKKTGSVYDDFDAEWFSDWLIDSYKTRTDEPLGFEVKKFAEIERKKIVLLNCLDTLYGHSLLKLLNAQYYTNRPDVSLIVLLPANLEWLLPDGAAEAWIVDLPLRRGTEWNDWLAREISRRLEPFSDVFLSVGFSHPHSDDFEIERFTRIKPFPLENWAETVGTNPCVTFIWRDDRLWETSRGESLNRFGKIKQRFGSKPKNALNEQLEKVILFAEELRAEIPKLDFAVAGLGKANGLPNWISDLRLTKLNADAERAWCERYAQSLIVIGVHGSNMLLPSAHAGAVIELIGEDRRGNFLQDILFRRADFREMFFRYRFVPFSTAPEELARTAAAIMRYADFRRLMSPEFCRHQENYDFERWLSARRRKTIDQSGDKH